MCSKQDIIHRKNLHTPRTHHYATPWHFFLHSTDVDEIRGILKRLYGISIEPPKRVNSDADKQSASADKPIASADEQNTWDNKQSTDTAKQNNTPSTYEIINGIVYASGCLCKTIDNSSYGFENFPTHKPFGEFEHVIPDFDQNSGDYRNIGLFLALDALLHICALEAVEHVQKTKQCVLDAEQCAYETNERFLEAEQLALKAEDAKQRLLKIAEHVRKAKQLALEADEHVREAEQLALKTNECVCEAEQSTLEAEAYVCRTRKYACKAKERVRTAKTLAKEAMEIACYRSLSDMIYTHGEIVNPSSSKQTSKSRSKAETNAISYATNKFRNFSSDTVVGWHLGVPDKTQKNVQISFPKLVLKNKVCKRT